jgi:hypothetical protein
MQIGIGTSDQDTGAGGRSGAASFHSDSNGLLWIFGGYNNPQANVELQSFDKRVQMGCWIQKTHWHSQNLDLR